MRAQLFAGLRAIVVITVLFGIIYPLVVTGVAQVAFGEQANGSLIRHNGTVVGSRLLGQHFEGPEWFHSRPSAAGDGYDAMASGASNLGPTNPELVATIRERARHYRRINHLATDTPVPIDAVTASGSGLDPHISIANARLQAPRVAEARGLPLDRVLHLIDVHTDDRSLGILGEPGVNVLELNVSLSTGK